MTNEEIMTSIKPAILAQLKSPASAQFPEDLISISNDENKYHIEGFVDSQNSYGAMLRNDFVVNAEIENELLKVISCKVGVKANIQRAEEYGKNYAAALIFTIIVGAILYFIFSM